MPSIPTPLRFSFGLCSHHLDRCSQKLFAIEFGILCATALLKAFETKSGNSSTISNNHDHESWYDPSIKRTYWDSHKEWLLENSKKPIDVVNEIDKSTDEILGLLENPKRIQKGVEHLGLLIF